MKWFVLLFAFVVLFYSCESEYNSGGPSLETLVIQRDSLDSVRKEIMKRDELLRTSHK